LIFCGFIVAECRLKDDTKAIMKELLFSSHEIKMITGDNALTAAFVGQQLNFGQGESLFALQCPSEGTLIWHDIDDKRVCKTETEDELIKIYKSNLLCVSGDVLSKVFEMKDHI
jgi:cation-transporting ATPase 13A1